MVHTYIVLFAIASAVGIAVSRTRVPYAVALVVVGLALGALHLVDPPRLTKDLLFALFLPGLVFEAAYNLHFRELKRGWRFVALLAGPGVIVAIVVTGFAAAALLQAVGVPDFSWKTGLVFAALVSATDPIAVVSLFRTLGVAPKLTTLVEAESLFNDGTAIVALTLILAYVTGESSSAGALAVRFAVIVCGGSAVGAAVGYAIVIATRRVNDAMIEITLTTVGAFGSFVLAEDLHLSGVIATVVAGLVLGTVARETAFSQETRAAADAFWRYVAFALNSIVFLLIGFEIRPAALFGSAIPIAIGFVTVLLGRFLIVFGVAALLRKTPERVPGSWAVLVAWGGLRGALAMVLALALPFAFPQRTLLVNMTFGVVAASLLLQGLTIPALTRRLLKSA